MQKWDIRYWLGRIDRSKEWFGNIGRNVWEGEPVVSSSKISYKELFDLAGSTGDQDQFEFGRIGIVQKWV